MTAFVASLLFVLCQEQGPKPSEVTDLRAELGDGEMSVEGRTNLPRETVLAVTLTPLLRRYNEAMLQIVPDRVDPVHKPISVSDSGFTAKQRWSRLGGVEVEVRFSPNHPLASPKSKGFEAVRRTEVFTLGAPEKRTERILERWKKEASWVSHVERLGARMQAAIAGQKSKALAELYQELGVLHEKMTEARATSPFPAAVGYLDSLLMVFGAEGLDHLDLSLVARLPKSGAAQAELREYEKLDDRGEDWDKRDPGESELSDKTLRRSVDRARELFVRELALSINEEFEGLNDWILQGLKEDRGDLARKVASRVELLRKLCERSGSEGGQRYQELLKSDPLSEGCFKALLEELARAGEALGRPAGQAQEAGSVEESCVGRKACLSALAARWSTLPE